MNNDYDREFLSDTIELGDVSYDPAIKLVIMQNGAQVIAEVIEYMHADYYTLIDPRTVSLEVAIDADGNEIGNISYAAWAPLSADKRFQVYKSAVVSLCNALPSLEASYKGERENG